MTLSDEYAKLANYTHDIKERNERYTSITCRCGKHFNSLAEYGQHLSSLIASANPLSTLTEIARLCDPHE